MNLPPPHSITSSKQENDTLSLQEIGEDVTMVFKDIKGTALFEEPRGKFILGGVERYPNLEILLSYQRMPNSMIEVTSACDMQLLEQIMEELGYINLAKFFGITERLNRVALENMYVISSRGFEELENINHRYEH